MNTFAKKKFLVHVACKPCVHHSAAAAGSVQGVFFALFLFVLTTYLISEKAGDLYSSRRP